MRALLAGLTCVSWDNVPSLQQPTSQGMSGGLRQARMAGLNGTIGDCKRD
jgi:hypothetical protein